MGSGAATALLVTTQNAWPIVTSAMPIVAWWTNLIIMFELTMLGAILATGATFLITALAPGRNRSRFYDSGRLPMHTSWWVSHIPNRGFALRKCSPRWAAESTTRTRHEGTLTSVGRQFNRKACPMAIDAFAVEVAAVAFSN